jgi:hypothetical protein
MPLPIITLASGAFYALIILNVIKTECFIIRRQNEEIIERLKRLEKNLK